jgi:hypothetical protein
MAMNSDAPPKQGGSGGGELEKRLTGVEARLGVIEKTMVTAEVFERELGAVRGEIGALRDELHVGLAASRDELHVGLAASRQDTHAELRALRQEMNREFGVMRVEIAKVPFELVKWLIALSGIAAAIATTVYNIWFR